MRFIDTHTHLYLEPFDEDRPAMVERALGQGVGRMLLPHIDSRTTAAMTVMARQYPGVCLPMMGLHPTSVKENWEEELAHVERQLGTGGFCAIGEVGLDFYWDTSFRHQQETAFARQISLALHHRLPLVIHTRNALEEAITMVKDFLSRDAGTAGKQESVALTGVFHCFPGTAAQAEEVVGAGFYLGIGGVVTYKNSLMAKVVEATPLDRILLETDAPFLPPHPMRGKRNESSFLPYIAGKIAEIKGLTLEEVAGATSRNAMTLFRLS